MFVCYGCIFIFAKGQAVILWLSMCEVAGSAGGCHCASDDPHCHTGRRLGLDNPESNGINLAIPLYLFVCLLGTLATSAV